MYYLCIRNRSISRKLLICLTIIVILVINFKLYKDEKTKVSTKLYGPDLNYNLKDHITNFFKSLENEKPCAPSRQEIVKQFRALIRHHLDGSGNNFNPNRTCVLPPDIQNDEQFNVMMKRVKTLREVCRKDTPVELINPEGPSGVTVDNTQHMIVCKNPKAASNVIKKYFARYLTKTNENTTRNDVLSSIPGAVNRQLKDRDMYLAFHVVRHPFTKILSCYLNKIIRSKYYSDYYEKLYKRMFEFSTMSPTEVSKIMDKLLPENQRKTFNCPRPIKTQKKWTLKENLKVPSLRGFVLGIIETTLEHHGNTKDLFEEDGHHRLQGMSCSACKMEYDLVVKTETLREDFLFIENIMNLPPMYDMQMNDWAKQERVIYKKPNVENETEVLINGSNMRKTYGEYMSELFKTDFDLLYTAYFSDFEAYDYDPCYDLEIE